MSGRVAARVEGLVQAGDLKLHVTEIGEGPALVWLHGSGPGSTSVGTFEANLDAFEGRRHLLIDLPGFGHSEKSSVGGPLLPHAAARLADALGSLGIDEADFIGNSYGGGACLKLAADRPDLVRRVV